MAREIVLTLPRPYPLQHEIMNHPARRKVVCAGRRVGKTTLAALMSVEALLRGQRVLLSSTSQDQVDLFWNYVIDWTRGLRGVGDFYKNEVKRVLRFGAGHLYVKTGSKPDVLRGQAADLLVLDECAYLDPDAWYKVASPMLLDTNGTAVFISTPKRRNWFFHLYQRAVTDESGQWMAWNFASNENPYLNRMALEQLASDMTDADYRQEIMAEFLDDHGAVFRNVHERCTGQRVAPYSGSFVAGVDFAQANDYTVITVVDRAARRVVDYDRFNQQAWSVMRQRLAVMCERWQPEVVICEANSAGAPNIEALERSGLPVVSFMTTAQSKPPLIESLVLAFERGELTALDDPTFRAELMAYERRVSAVTGRSQYGAPDGMHDDCVMSLALAWWAVAGAGRFEIIAGA